MKNLKNLPETFISVIVKLEIPNYIKTTVEKIDLVGNPLTGGVR